MTTPIDELAGLTEHELQVLPRMRLDVGRYEAFRAEDVLVLLDIIDRLDRAARSTPVPAANVKTPPDPFDPDQRYLEDRVPASNVSEGLRQRAHIACCWCGEHHEEGE